MGIVNGMTRAVNALHYWELRQQAVANNLANADTNGFKAERPFAQLMGDALTVAGSVTDLKAGTLKPTGNPLDLAIGGKGFFVVQTPQGERLTRAGSFQLDATGKLVDDHGNAILGENGPIVAGKGTLVVDPSGTIKVDGREVGRLRIESVPQGATLTHAGDTLFIPPAGTASVPPTERGLKQGFLEESNVSTVGSMVDMIDIQRAYTNVERTVTTLDEVRKTISNELGRVL